MESRQPSLLTADGAKAALAAHAAAVRAAFPRQFKGGATECRACGLPIFDHSAEECAGSNLASGDSRGRGKRSGVNGTKAESGATNGTESLSGHLSGSNGAHDDGPLLDPDRVCQTLTERGWKIAYQQPFDGAPGIYVNSESFAEYDTGDVESQYRAALAGRS